MKTLIINGSPKGKLGNTEIFIRQFLIGTGQEMPVWYVVKESPCDLAEAACEYDTLLIFMPLYVHAMPGIVMKLFEEMKQARAGQKIVLVVQSGFIEGAQARFLIRYLNRFARRLGYENLGVVTNGDAAGTAFMPVFMTKKLFRRLQKLGAHYAEHGQFDKETAQLLAGMQNISAGNIKKYEFFNRTGLSHQFWHKFWRDNGVFEQGLDRPFVDK